MKISKVQRNFTLACGMILLAACTSVVAETQPAAIAQRTAAPAAASPANIVQYVRDRFQVPASVSVDAQPVHRSKFPHFYQTSVTVDDGKQRHVSDVFITDDARCFVAGNLFAMNDATSAELARCVRDAAKLPATAEVTVGPFSKTAFPEFLKSTLTVRVGTKVENGELYLTRDHRTGILGLVLPFRRDYVKQLIDARNQPSVGPANAPVTIVEYADLECPMCAYFQKFLESELLPRYPGKIRIVFKEFPLAFHPWSTTAAVANECAYQIDPSKFLNYRTLIFANQGTISATNPREVLLSLGEQAGLNKINLSQCVDAKASLGRIEAARTEAQTLGVNQTPTFFVNGRIVIGIRSAAAFYKAVDDALATPTAQE
ncbi:MAG TPA: DsbA family protein [Verrucomicrobiae bacterium]|nr:DsbA family protein [Verrucomicrobiae bacterium]